MSIASIVHWGLLQRGLQDLEYDLWQYISRDKMRLTLRDAAKAAKRIHKMRLGLSVYVHSPFRFFIKEYSLGRPPVCIPMVEVTYTGGYDYDVKSEPSTQLLS